MKQISLPPATNAFELALTPALQQIQVPDSGRSGDRPKVGLQVGQVFFDLTLQVPIWWRGDRWVRADGIAV